MAGTFVSDDTLRETLWTIDSVALIVAAAMPTMKYELRALSRQAC